MRARRLVWLVMFFLGLAATAVADDVVDGSFGPGAFYRLVRPTHGMEALCCTPTASRMLGTRSGYHPKVISSRAVRAGRVRRHVHELLGERVGRQGRR